jgi:hypothetical protein
VKILKLATGIIILSTIIMMIMKLCGVNISWDVVFSPIAFILFTLTGFAWLVVISLFLLLVSDSGSRSKK